ncbi:MAG: acyl--CoA ligase [Acidobacteria bacterium]|nr:acyl--CoA ligase [Acidobacteriota bacterium]
MKTEDHIALHARTIGDRIAVIDDQPGRRSVTLTYRELDAAVNRLANALIELGVKRDDSVLWCGPNSVVTLTAIHAARKIGAVSVPLPYRLTHSEASYICEHSDATVAIVDAEYRGLLDDAPDNITEIIVFDNAEDARLADDDIDYATLPDDFSSPPAQLADEATRLMIYTSGTTGVPKGAVRSIGGAANQFGALLELFGWPGTNVVFLTTGPLYHSGPSGFALRSMLVGSTVVLQRKFDAEDWLRLVDTYGVTATFSAPTPIRRVVELDAEVRARYDTSTMHTMIANAAPWTTSLKQAYVDALGQESLWEVYGSTELSVVTVLEPPDQLRKPGSCGRPAPGVEIRLYAEDDSIVDEVGVPGEVFVRSAGVFETYHRDPERFSEDHRDGFQTCGDIAYVDEEGFYFICDRKKDVIISGGTNIYPAEIENVLDACPAVNEVAVIGVPDEEWGEAVCAVVVKTDPSADDVETMTAIRAFGREQLAGYKTPKLIRFIDELPKTGTGKVLKRVLRADHTS